MAKYKIVFNRAYLKDLQKIPTRDQKHIVEKLQELSLNPRPDGVKKLRGNSIPPLHRIRCRDYRIVYTIDDKILLVLVIAVGHRKGIYRRI